MKTTLELPDELMRAIKVRAASSDRKLKDVIAEAIARGLSAAVADETSAAAPQPRKRKSTRRAVAYTPAVDAPARKYGATIAREQLDAIFAAGDELVRKGVDVESWIKHSRDVWR